MTSRETFTHLNTHKNLPLAASVCQGAACSLLNRVNLLPAERSGSAGANFQSSSLSCFDAIS